MKKHLLFLFLLVAMSSHAQLRTGLLVGGGLGFDRNVAPNMKNPDIIEKVAKGTKLFEDYKFNLQLGYRFRIEDKKHTRWFYDIDPLVNAECLNQKMSGLTEVVLRRTMRIFHSPCLLPLIIRS